MFSKKLLKDKNRIDMKKNIVTLIFVLLLHFVSTAQGHFYCGIDDEHNNRQERTIIKVVAVKSQQENMVLYWQLHQ